VGERARESGGGKIAGIDTAQISLRTYQARLAVHPEQEYEQKPFEEYLRLLVIQGESNKTDPDLLCQFQKTRAAWRKVAKEQHDQQQKEIDTCVKSYGLAGWLNKQ